MRRTLRTLTAGFAAGLVITALLLTPPAAEAATPKPNDSIFFYKPGTAVTGILNKGIFTQKRVLSMSGWRKAAVSRDTLLLYNSANGHVKTGTLLGGIITATKTQTIAKGWNTVTASCDTVLFYNRSTGAGFTATLRGGVMGKTLTRYHFSTGWDFIDASCNTVTFLADGTSSASGVNGLLKAGKFSQTGGGFAVAPYTNVIHTKDSYLFYSSATRSGIWGPSNNGTEGLSGSATGFSPWGILAGTADSVLFYNTGGTWATATMVNGQYAFVDSGSNFSSGWTVIAGGR